jgi:hypothetical protein
MDSQDYISVQYLRGWFGKKVETPHYLRVDNDYIIAKTFYAIATTRHHA